MNICIVTGSGGLIGSESVSFFADKFDLIVGIDNDMRSYFFGQDASTSWNKHKLEEEHQNYKHYNIDIRDNAALESLFKEYNEDIKLIVHTAAQPSHDWAAKEPFTDFTVNANGTLNMLEYTRLYAPTSCIYFHFNQQGIW
jgi:CDP-paratose 2-epimerase